jgi:hypothetical protein
MLAGLADRIAGTAFADWAMSSPWAYPVANTVHVLALVLLLGGIGLVDLRVLGLFRKLPLTPLASALIPIAASGVLILAASGSVMFAADAKALADNGTFRLKLVLIAVAIANVALFRWRFRKAMPQRPPTGAKLLALASFALWLSIAIAGRMIAYSE